MTLTDKDKEALREDLSQLSDEQLDAMEKPLKTLRDSLDDVNSAFPATQEFLIARGLTRVSQLDATGREELTEHLKAIIRRIAN